MSDADTPIPLAPEPVEGPRQSVELVRDEDVLSRELQHALEQVGSAVGVVAVIALLVAQLPRAKRMLTSVGGASQARHGGAA